MSPRTAELDHLDVEPVHPERAAAPPSPRVLPLILLLGALTALGPLTIDLYLPAFPAITDDLLTTEAAVQLTLTGTLIGMALGQVLIGPLSDAIGRRRPLLGGAAAYVLASAACAIAPNVTALGALRVLQGMAAAAGSVIAMAVIRDHFAGLRGVQMLSRLMLVMGVAPVLAPTLGGFILTLTDWRGVFWLLSGIGAVLTVVVIVGMRETLPVERRIPLGLRATLRTYATLLRDRSLVGLVLTGGLVMAGLFSYIAGSSFVLQGVYGLSPQQYGVLFGLNSVGLIAATQLNARLVGRFEPQHILTVALAIAAAAAAVLVLGAALPDVGVLGIVVPLFVLLSMVGLSLPNVAGLALVSHGESAGTTAALLGATNFGVGAISAPIVGQLGTATAVPMAAVMLVSAILALLAFVLVARPRRMPAFERDAVVAHAGAAAGE